MSEFRRVYRSVEQFSDGSLETFGRWHTLGPALAVIITEAAAKRTDTDRECEFIYWIEVKYERAGEWIRLYEITSLLDGEVDVKRLTDRVI